MAREGALQLEAVLVDRRAQRDLEALIIAIASAGVSRYPSRHVCFTKTTPLLTQLQGGGSHDAASSLRLDLGTAFRVEGRRFPMSEPSRRSTSCAWRPLISASPWRRSPSRWSW